MNKILLYILVAFVVLLAGCTTKSNTYYNRQFQMIPTMYNVLYNGNLAFEEGKKEIDQKYQDNYFEILPVEPIRMSDAVQLNGLENPHFTRAEEKAIKAIQKHSMVFDGVQRNRKIDDAYMLLGKARFYNERFIPAMEAFNHLLMNYGQTNRRNEAAVWREKTNMQLGRDRLAIINLQNLLQSEIKLKKQERSDAQAVAAQAFINVKEYQNATKMLSEAGKNTRKKALRGRYYFIAGQVFEQLQQLDSALVYYQKVIDLNRKIPRKLWIEAQAGKARTASFSSEEEKEFLAFLEKMQRQYEHKSFLDVLYFQSAVLLKKKGDLPSAADFFHKSLKNNAENTPLKQKSHQNLAEIYFDKKDYVKAHTHYDSTLVFVPENTLEHLYIRRKRDNLAQIASLETAVKEADSILTIARMSDTERTHFFKKYTDSLEKEVQKNAPKITDFGREGKIKIQQQDPNIFYFSNPSAVAYGKQMFAKQFGNRPLVDNWRYSSLIVNIQSVDNEKDSLSVKAKPKNVNFEMPSEGELQILSEKRNQNLYNLAVIYSEKFGDNSLAINSLNKIASPENNAELHPRVQYLYYKLYDQTNNPQKEKFKAILLEKYPDSRYAKLLSGATQTDLATLNDTFKELTQAFENQEFLKVIETIEANKSAYLASPVAPNWEMLRAKANGRLQGVKVYRTMLEDIKKAYPNTPQSAEIEAILKSLSPMDKVPDFEPETNASSWKIVSQIYDEENIIPLKKWLEEHQFGQVKLTQDVYNSSEKWLVLHGFPTKNHALDLIEKINSDPKNRFLEKLFVISAENYAIIQLYKNKEQYKSE